MVSSGKHFFGLDIGGTAIKAVVLSGNEILTRSEWPSHAKQGPLAVKKAILEGIAELKKQGFTPAGIGLGCAGSVSGDGVVRNSPNFYNWHDVPLRKWIADASEMKRVIIENDANCATMAEWLLTDLKNVSNIVLITLGTGIGGGLVINGKLYRGTTGTAGEIGHFSIDSHGIACACGNTGCFERYCSATALAEQFPNLSAKEIFEKRDTEPFKRTVDEFIYRLKVGLTSIANLFDPEYILLGGAVSNGLGADLPDLQEWVKTRAFEAVGNQTKIRLTLFGNWSGAMGAAALASRECDKA